MRALSLRFLFLASVFPFLMTGCGGGGNSGGGGSTGGGADNNPTLVSFTFNAGTPTTVAAKIGQGAFTAKTLSSGELSLSIPSGTTDYAVAYMCELSSTPNVEYVFEGSTADGSGILLPCLGPFPQTATATLTGSVDASAIAGASLVSVAVADGSIGFVGGVAPVSSFSLLNVPAGNDRVVLLASSSPVAQGSVTTFNTLAAKSFSGQIVPGPLNGGAPVVLGSADATTSQPVSYGNIPTGYSAPYTSTTYHLGNSGGYSLAVSTTQYPVLPSGATASGDYYVLYTIASSNSNANEMIIAAKSFTSAGPVLFTLPVPWTYSGPTPGALATFNFAYSALTGSADFYQFASEQWSTAAVGSLQIQISATANYQNGSTALAVPDLSGLAGFLSPPPSGTKVSWTAQIVEGASGVPAQMPSSGAQTTLQNSGSFTVP